MAAIKDVHVLVFGASITYGAWDMEGGWADRLKRYLFRRSVDENAIYLLYNCAVSGDRSNEILKRFDSEAGSRAGEDIENVIIFSVGTNDSAFAHSKRGNWTSPEDYEKNLHEIVALAKKLSSKILFVGLCPVDEDKTNPIPWNTDKSYKNEYIEKYDKIAKSICEKSGIPFIDVFGEWIKHDYKTLLQDGVHPNSEGHKMLFEKIKMFLDENRTV